MTLVNQIKKDSIQAMKDGDKTKLASLRLLIAELEKEKVKFKLAEVTGLTDEQTEAVISREIKKINNAIEEYEKVGKSTIAHYVEKALLLEYMPEQLSVEEIRSHVLYALELMELGDIKNPMQYLSPKLKGKADMKLVAQIVKETI